MTDEVKLGILSSTFQFPEIMLNIITSSVSDSLAILRQAQDKLSPEYLDPPKRLREGAARR